MSPCHNGAIAGVCHKKGAALVPDKVVRLGTMEG